MNAEEEEGVWDGGTFLRNQALELTDLKKCELLGTNGSSFKAQMRSGEAQGLKKMY